MQYREIGKTGIKASVIGLGAEHLDNKPYETVEEVIHAALEHEMNIVDVFMGGSEVRENIGKALGSRRKDMIIQGHIGSVVTAENQYDISRDLDTCRKNFEDMLRLMNTDYIDLGMLFFIDSDDAFDSVFNSSIVTYVQNLKRDGVIRAIGASSHNARVAKRVAESGIVDLIMFSVNPLFDLMPGGIDLDSMFKDDTIHNVDTSDPARLDLYRFCERENVSITVMKALCAGKLLYKEATPFAKPLTVGQCIHYALTRPAVASVLVGCKNRAEVEEAVGYLKLSDEDRDYSSIISTFGKAFTGMCMYCNHCQPCPSELDIASLHRYYDIARLNPANIPPSVRQHYESLENHASGCIECGSCENRCPFGVPVIENMRGAAELFGK